MGLDMYLDKINMKITQDEVKDFTKYRNMKCELEDSTEFLEHIDTFDNIRDYIVERFERKIKQFDEGKKDQPLYNIYAVGVKKLEDFDTKEELIQAYVDDCKKAIKEMTEKINTALEDEEYARLHEKYKDVEKERIQYWRKHSDLNGYFADLAYKKDIKDFNCHYLVVTKKDVRTLLNTINAGGNKLKEASGFFWGTSTEEDYHNTKEVFTDLLNNFDFENNTLLYHCWW